MAGVTNGAELVQKLARTGTGAGKLAVARAELARVKNEDGRVATADEVIAALDRRFGADHLTVAKAREIAAVGEWKGPAAAGDVPIEEQLLAEKKAEKEPEKKRPEGGKDK